MPTKPPRVCSRCRKPVQGRCPTCEKPWAQKPQAWANGSTRRWRKVRAMKLRTNPVCEWPGCGLLADVVHHETDDYERDRYNWAVLWSLCNKHHDEATSNRRRGGRGVPATREAWPRPPAG